MRRRDFLAMAAAATVPLPHADYDTVILEGRVIDPETKLDTVRNVGISGGTIANVTSRPIRGKRTIDAKGLVVAPGFIDPIAHGQDEENDRLQLLDGVTTKLQLEAGAEDVNDWYAEQLGRRYCNYGTGTGHVRARMAVLGEEGSADRVADEKQVNQMVEFVHAGLSQGALAVGFGLEYQPASTRWEVLEIFRTAAAHKACCHSHVRYGTVFDDQSAVVGVQEMLAASMASGAPVHICHVPSMGLGRTIEALRLIERVQARGHDVTCDFYPYTAFGTGIGSEVFADGWQERFGITYSDLEWARTHERLTEETFGKYRAEGGMVVAHAIPETAVAAAVKSPATMVGSDGGLTDGVGHPRSSGSFARVLGRYVREQGLLSLPEALEKSSLRAAKRMEARCPDFNKKGRIQRGADADIVVFDPGTVIDKATFSEPALPSFGIVSVLLGGNPVVIDGQLYDGPALGRPLRGPRR